MSKTKIPMEFHQALEVGGVNEKTGVISGVSIITSGVTALGHKIEVDDTTLLEMQVAAQARGKVPVKWNHKTGADEVCGYLKNFRVDDGKLKGDWHLMKSHPKRAQALELASEMPESVGLSASFFGKNEKKDGKEFARCKRLQSVDLVAAPAANPNGLFAEGSVDSDAEVMAKKVTPVEDAPVDLNQIMGAITAFSAKQDDVIARLTTLEEGTVDDGDGGDTDDGEEDDAREFESLSDVMSYFEERLATAETAREEARQEQAFEEVEERFNALLELNEQMRGENELLARAYTELSEHTGQEVELTAGANDEGYEATITGGGDGVELTAFEARVLELQTGDDPKDPGTAMIFAMEENRTRYEQHLEAKGAIAQSL